MYVQPIISKARADLLKSHFLPTLEKLKKKTVKVVAEEELLKADSKGDTQEAELLILDEFAVLCRDLYAFYPMLIRYVDNNRSDSESLSWATKSMYFAGDLSFGKQMYLHMFTKTQILIRIGIFFKKRKIINYSRVKTRLLRRCTIRSGGPHKLMWRATVGPRALSLTHCRTCLHFHMFFFLSVSPQVQVVKRTGCRLQWALQNGCWNFYSLVQVTCKLFSA